MKINTAVAARDKPFDTEARGGGLFGGEGADVGGLRARRFTGGTAATEGRCGMTDLEGGAIGVLRA